jgi:putative addiction module component (TIGR02574 family)
VTRTLDEIRNDALQLPVEDRMQLMEALHESVMISEEREIEQAWLEEAERRYQDWKAGRAHSVPGEEVMARLRQKYGGDGIGRRSERAKARSPILAPAYTS